MHRDSENTGDSGNLGNLGYSGNSSYLGSSPLVVWAADMPPGAWR